jgi:hypothetical protein
MSPKQSSVVIVPLCRPGTPERSVARNEDKDYSVESVTSCTPPGWPPD